MFDPAHDGWKPRTLEGFIGLVGPLWTKRQGGTWNYGILAEDKHANLAGFVHGGMLTTLMDHALSIIAWEANERQPCITVALDVHFLAAGRPGDFIAAGGRIVRQTSALVFMQGSLSVEGKEIVTGAAIVKVVGPNRTLA